MKKCGLLLLCLLLSFTACGTPRDGDPHTRMGVAFDTYYDLTLYGKQETLVHCAALIDQLEGVLSATRQGGELFRINHTDAATVPLESPHLSALLTEALDYAALTDGAFDFTLGQLKELWRIEDEAAPLPTPAQIAHALNNSGYLRVQKKDGLLSRDGAVQLDMGGIAKGYALDQLVALCREEGAAGGILDFGGTVAVFGEKPSGGDYNIGIRDPYVQGADNIGYVTLPCNKTSIVSVAGVYRRYKVVEGKTYPHIFDFQTGYPIDNDLVSVAVVAESGSMADALCTALLVMGKEGAEDFCRRHALDLDFTAVLFTKAGEAVVHGSLPYTPINR